MIDQYYLVAVDSIFNDSLLTYKHNCVESSQLAPGTMVKVPLGKREIDGCVWEKTKPSSDIDLKKIKEIISVKEELSLSESEVALYKWMSAYYHYPVGKLISDTLPEVMKRPRKLTTHEGKSKNIIIEKNEDQSLAVEKILQNGLVGFSKWLVHGVTGAGKTIVYLDLIKKVLENKKSVLFLLPEINLTPQFLKTFQEHLSVPIYLYNSSISKSDKYGLWKLLQDEETPVLILAVRSGVFLPVKKLGLIIVDEEHDQSFKQDDRCTYNARDVAIKRASLEKIPVILGSATPMVETYNAFVGTPNYISLKKRALSSSLPDVEIVSMKGRSKIESERMLWPYTSECIEKIKEALQKGEQVLVFINRLGYANYLQCNSCGHQFACPNCSTNLKFFKNRHELSCQTCEYKERGPEMCPECMNLTLAPKGFGTEKAHELLTELIPNKKIERFDRDEIKTFEKLESVLERFHKKDIDILVGTQMLSKGHNFENVNLVLILGIDSQLNFPDFRSNERVYQTLTQVSGRAGRFGKKALVQVLTLAPENKVYTYLKKHSFDEFYEDEVPLRKMCSSPPFKKIALIYFNSKSQNTVISEASQATSNLRTLCQDHFKDVEILGPRPSMIEKKVNKFTWSIMIRSSDINQLHNLITTFKRNYDQPHTISLKIDVDPYYFD